MKRIWIVVIGFIVISLGLFMIGMNVFNTSSREPNQNNTDLPMPLRGTVTQSEQGKDGLQVVLQTDVLLYNVTISQLQAEIIGSFDQILVGAEIEVSGQAIAGMDPPLIVAQHVKVLTGSNSLTGVIWTLTQYNGQEPLPGQLPTLSFEGDGISGTTGCNHYGGSYQIIGEAIDINEIFHTEMACQDPDGIMGQEVIYLELLRSADRYQRMDNQLTFFCGPDPILVFVLQSDVPAQIETTLEPQDPDTETVSATTAAPLFVAPDGYQEYLDQAAGVSLYIPESWNVTGIIGGEYAIFQSYPLDKYIGGEGREEGDTKCDLNIQASGIRLEDLIDQWNSDTFTTILSEGDFEFAHGVIGKRYVIASLGESVTFTVMINSRLVLLTCFGDYSEIDTIATTIQEIE